MDPENAASASGLPEDRPVPTPEDFIGTVLNGGQHRIEAIEAIGSKFVVFRARNLATNEVDVVFKVLHEEFDPRRPLLEALPGALENLSQDPDRVIRICQRLLDLDPTDEAPAFNLGVACYVKKDIAGALAAFERALSLAPEDCFNLVHRASCLALLERDAECLHDFLKTTPERDAVRTVLASVRPHALNIQTALGRLSKRGTGDLAAMHALDEFF